jgi:anti-sigma28 factor (negative regulator of flagellin synthesis)
MKVTGRLGTKKSVRDKAIAAAGSGDIGRQARVEELRRMVAGGRYRVDPYRLALRILVRALSRHE